MLKNPINSYDSISDDYRNKVRGRDETHKGRLASTLHTNRFNQVMGMIPKKKLHVLDFGCGSGEFLVSLAKAGHSGVGIDTSPNLIADALSLRDETQSNCDFIVGNAYSIPEGKYDLIVALSVILFMTEDEERKLYEFAIANLAPDGVLIANYYNSLIDISTANRFTRRFCCDAMKRSGFPLGRMGSIDSQIEQVLPHSLASAEYQTDTMRDSTTIRGRHPFHIERELSSYGFLVEKFIFTRYHLVPPYIAEKPENFDLYQHQVQFVEDATSAEYGPVMASNMIIRMRPA
jgi:SAM-dependent methyltransferase